MKASLKENTILTWYKQIFQGVPPCLPNLIVFLEERNFKIHKKQIFSLFFQKCLVFCF